jgi:hypothetical protein
MDAIFISTVKYHSILSYNFLLLGPIFDGLLGGYRFVLCLVSPTVLSF